MTYCAFRSVSNVREFSNDAWPFIACICLATLAYYSLHRWHGSRQPLVANATARSAYYRRHSALLLMTGVLATAAAFLLWLKLSASPRQWLAVMTLLALPYSLPLWRSRGLRQWGLLKPVYVALVWTVLCWVIPQLQHGKIVWVAAVAMFLFLLGLAMAFDRRDAAADGLAGVVTLSGKLGTTRTHHVVTGLWLLATLLLLGQLLYHMAQHEHAVAGATAAVATAPLVGLYIWRRMLPRQQVPRPDVAPEWHYDVLLDGLLLLPALVLVLIDAL